MMDIPRRRRRRKKKCPKKMNFTQETSPNITTQWKFYAQRKWKWKSKRRHRNNPFSIEGEDNVVIR